MEGTTNPAEDPWWDDLFDYYLNYDNISYDEIDQEFPLCGMSTDSQPEFLPVLYSVMFVVGILGNGLLLGVLINCRKIWGITDTFILHRVVADILLLMTLPLWAAESASDTGWMFGTIICKITGSVFRINFYCGILLLVCISVSCYLSIVHSTKMFTEKKPWVVHGCCAVLLLLSMLFSIPDWIFSEALQDQRRGKTVCVRFYQKFDVDVRTYIMVERGLFHTVGFAVPSVVLIFCFSCIQWKLWCRPKGHQKQSTFKTIAAVLVDFFLCWAPFNITFIVDTFEAATSVETTCASKQFLNEALIVTCALGCIHCCFNPILCFLIDVKYRRQLMNMWTKTSSNSVY